MPANFEVASPEIALVLACLRARYNRSEHIDPIRVSAGVDWSEVLSIASCHGIVPLVFVTLTAAGEPVPNGARELLRPEFHRSAANSFLYATELVRLLESLREKKISALALKGPALATLLYRKLSLRTVRDLDILVEKHQVGPAMEVLRACGYMPAEGLEGAGPSVEAKLRKHALLIHQGAGFNVELHWAVTDPSFALPLNFDQLWNERQLVTILAQPVATLGQEDTLLTMCAHATNHCWGSLKWICDIAQAVSSFPALDWGRILARAQELGCSRMLFVGLALASELCGISLPKTLEADVRSMKVRRLCREAQRTLFLDTAPRVNLDRTLSYIRSRERFRDRIRIALRFIGLELRPNARDRALVRLPDALQFLYFPFRFVRLALFCWKRAILPIVQDALGWPRHRDWAAASSEPASP